MQVLVTGATGFLGAHLVRALLAEDFGVVAFARTSSNTAALEAAGVRVVRGSLTNERDVRSAYHEVDAIVHAAGGGIARRVADIYHSNTESTRCLAAWAPPSLQHFVLVSSLAVHGPSRRGRATTEHDPDTPRSHYGKSKLQAEHEALAHQGRFCVTVLRPPTLYGPGEHRLVQLFVAARRGIVPMVHPEGELSMLHVPIALV